MPLTDATVLKSSISEDTVATTTSISSHSGSKLRDGFPQARASGLLRQYTSQRNAHIPGRGCFYVPTAYGEQANHSFIRSTMRKTIAAVESEIHGSSDGIGSVGLTETLGGVLGVFEEGCGVGGVVSGDAALHDARIIIDMDRVSWAEVDVLSA